MAGEDEARKRHHQLLSEFVQEFDTEGPGYAIFIQLLRGLGIPKGTLANAKTLPQKLSLMTDKGKLGIGNYDKLKEITQEVDKDLIPLIERAEGDIRRIRSGGAANSQGPATPGNSNTKRKRNEEPADDADPLYMRRGNKSYYDTRGKRGFLLILNSYTNRAGTQRDVDTLVSLFGGELGFTVRDPRGYTDRDFTLGELEDCLGRTKRMLNDPSESDQYYCFVCAILSHGNEQGIGTADGRLKSVDDIRKSFKNENVPNFAGKPKVFFIQACRGSDHQDGVTVDEHDDQSMETPCMQPPIPPVDESDQNVCIPSDADVLLAYATTPGYRANRRVAGERTGSWFIQQVAETFRNGYASDHVEEMMIEVREKIAVSGEWNLSDNRLQMPCTWSTLTKRLKLERST